MYASIALLYLYHFFPSHISPQLRSSLTRRRGRARNSVEEDSERGSERGTQKEDVRVEGLGDVVDDGGEVDEEGEDREVSGRESKVGCGC